jgi:hypothetical protein
MDTGDRALTHVRKESGSDWMTATRYNQDLDGNGLALEGEGGGSPNYLGTEIVLFRLSELEQIYPLAGTGIDCDTATTVCANSSWTDDGKLILLNDTRSGDATNWLKRASFSSRPAVGAVESLEIPNGLLAPVDPHQHGNSDSTGTVVFAAAVNLEPSGVPADRWARPLWRMPATGAASIGPGGAELVGCPTCVADAGCCTSATLEGIFGTNDPRINHAGDQVLWMHRHPDVYGEVVPGVNFAPYRQVRRDLAGTGEQVVLPTGPIAGATTHAYAEWRGDDQEAVYWEIWFEGTSASDLVIRETLSVMDADGTNRRPVPLPRELCAAHPSYLDEQTLIFTGWRCGGARCTCVADAL